MHRFSIAAGEAASASAIGEAVEVVARRRTVRVIGSFMFGKALG
jgi:hypothetical protein